MSRLLLVTALSVCLAATSPLAQEVKRPSSLPSVTWDCYQAYTTAQSPPESRFNTIAIDGDNFDEPLVRYRLQVIGADTLKIIRDPSRPALRTERGVSIFEMTRDFTNKHRIVGWRELDRGEAVLYTVDFDNKLFSVMNIPPSRAIVDIVKLTVMKCR